VSDELTLNPFHYQSPIRDPEFFFDRGSDTKKVLDRVRRGASVSIVGREKIGKTSFLHHVSNPRVAARYGLSLPSHQFFYVDCKSLAAIGEDDVFQRVKAVVEQTVLTGAKHSALSLGDIEFLTPYDWLKKAFYRFEAEGIQPIIQLDDFDGLAANARLGNDFFQGLRALTSVHYTMAYLTTSRLPLISLGYESPCAPGSPFFNIFRMFKLHSFSLGESRRFLAARLESVGAVFSEIILRSVIDLSQGEPYRLQLGGACAYDVWCEHGCRLSEEQWGEIEQRFNDAIGMNADDTG